MEFKINNRKWKIVETNQDVMCSIEGVEKEKGLTFFGLTCYENQTIYLWETLSKEQKRQTLLHELMHCYIGTYVSFQDLQLTEDFMCNISANSHDIIHDIVEKYFKKVEK